MNVDANLTTERQGQLKKRYLEQRKEKLSELEKLKRELPDRYEKEVQIKSINSELVESLEN